MSLFSSIVAAVGVNGGRGQGEGVMSSSSDPVHFGQLGLLQSSETGCEASENPSAKYNIPD